MLRKVILIYAKCIEFDAKGDYTFAANIAKDMARSLFANKEDIQLMLTSTLDSIAIFKSLYKSNDKNQILVDDQLINLCALESIDPHSTEVLAFVEANRCAFAPATLLKPILKARTKFIFIFAPNRHKIQNNTYQSFRFIQQLRTEQQDIYEHYQYSDIFVGTAGMGDEFLGLPYLTRIDEPPIHPLVSGLTIADTKYGFIYVSNLKDIKTIAQFMVLTGYPSYVLIGSICVNEDEIKSAYSTYLQAYGQTFINFPKINFHLSVSNRCMLNLIANSEGPIVCTTGTMSTIEAMHNKKITFFQNFPNNKEFENAYLFSVKDYFVRFPSVDSKFIIELVNILFAKKPLNINQMKRVAQLTNKKLVCEQLILANQTIIQHANGTLSSKLLKFIQQSSVTNHLVKSSLYEPKEKTEELNEAMCNKPTF